jgi:hypothetical protein
LSLPFSRKTIHQTHQKFLDPPLILLPTIAFLRKRLINNSDNDNFFCFYDKSEKNNEDTTELDMYLNDTASDTSGLHRYPLVKNVFVGLNTTLPSSAQVERRFSLGGQILTPRQNGLSKDHFEMLLLLRANKTV